MANGFGQKGNTPFAQVAARAPMNDMKAAGRAKAAESVLRQQAVSQATGPAGRAQLPGGTVTGVAQQAAPQIAQAVGQAEAGRIGQETQKAAQIGQAEVNDLRFGTAETLSNLEREQGLALGAAARKQALSGQMAEIAARKKITGDEIDSAQRLQAYGIDVDNRLHGMSLKQREDLAKLGLNVKQQLLDERLAFEKDARGHRFTSARQLADYARTAAKDNIDFNQKMKTMTQEADRAAMLYDQMAKSLTQKVTNEYKGRKSKKDLENKRVIQKQINDLKREAERKRAEASSSRALWKGGGMILGAAAGLALGMGNPTGAAAGAAFGAQIGGGLGEAASGISN